MREKYTEFYESNRVNACNLHSAGITEDFLCPKITKWFDENGRWVKNYGLSLVTFIPKSTLRNCLINAQAEIGKFFNCQGLGNAWVPIENNRFHMTIRPVNVNNITKYPPRTAPISQLREHAGRIEQRISQIGKPFKISFERVFQSPGDGRLSVEGIPVSFEDYKAIMKLRTMRLLDLDPYGHQMVHIAIGTIRQPMTAQQVKDLHDKPIVEINKKEKFGQLYADTAYLVHHSNDHFADDHFAEQVNFIVRSFPL